MLGVKIGVDLGTTSILIYVDGKGIVLTEPSVAAYEAKTNRLIAVGKKAQDMLGRNPDSIRVVKPMRSGVISDFTATKHIIRYFIQKICKNMVFKPNIIVCVPSTVTSLEKRTILNLVTASGAGKACLIEEPLAAALGAGVDVSHPLGTLVVDIGGGTTDIAVITMGNVSISRSVKVAGNTFDDAIVRHMRRERNVVIGERTAEWIKKELGCAYMRDAEIAKSVKGKNYISGMPTRVEVTSTEIFLAIREHLEVIVEGIRSVVEVTPPELVGDISENGIVLTGGGALLQGMDIMLETKTGIKTALAEEPGSCVALGMGAAMDNMEILIENGHFFKTREEIIGYRE